MRRFQLTGLVALIGLLAAIAASAGAADTANDALARGKHATALVEIPGKRGPAGYGSAFCIDPAGFFVTNQHVVALAEGKLKLILNPSEKDQSIVDAVVLRIDKTADLALLKVDSEAPQGLTALELGTNDNLIETAQLTAFGFPLGRSFAASRKEYPSISVSTGHVTSLRKVKGELEAIQLDATLTYGNSGGPVVDTAGRVVGVVVAGVPGVSINFAIPVSKLTDLLKTPEIVFDPGSIPAAKQSEPREFVIRIATFGQRTATAPSVDLVLGGGAVPQRTFSAADAGGGVYRVSAVPMPPPKDGARSLRISARFAGGSLAGVAKDGEVSVGTRKLKLSEIGRIEREPAKRIVLANGEVINGELVVGATVDLDLGGSSSSIDLSKAASVTIADAAGPLPGVDYRVVVRRDKEVIGTREGAIRILSADGRAGAAASRPVLAEAPVKDQTVVRLPAPAEVHAVGGGGRYIVFHLPKLQKLAVFDTAEARVVSYLSINADNIVFTASVDKVFVGLKDDKAIQRWDLASGEKELTVRSPEEKIDSLCTGWAASGPLLLNNNVFIDTVTMKRLDLRGANTIPRGDNPNVRASGDGSAFFEWWPNTSIHVAMQGSQIVWNHVEVSEHATLSMDGSLVFMRNRISTPDNKQISPDRFNDTWVMATYDPNYFVAARRPDDQARRRGGGNSGDPIWPVSFYTVSDQQLVLVLPPMDEMTNLEVRGGEGSASLEQRLFVIPAASLIVTLPATMDRLVLRRFNVVEALDAAGIDYLMPTSTPVRTAVRGGAYRYQVQAISKRGNVQYRLDSGPDGMKVNSTGLVEWNVPTDFAGKQTGVIISIRDASGQETFHSFNVQVE